MPYKNKSIEDFLLDSIPDDIPEDWHTIDKNGNREFKKTYLERFPKRVYFTIYGNLLERQDFNNKRIEGIYVPNLLKYDQLQKRSIQDPIKTGMMPSLVFDYTTRQKIGRSHASISYVKEFPVLTPKQIFIGLRTGHCGACSTPLRLGWLDRRVARRVHRRVQEYDHSEGPVKWDEEQRAMWQAELDAIFVIYMVLPL